MLNSMLQQDGLVGLDACKTALERLQRPFQGIGITIAILPKNNDLYTSIADQVRPAKTIPTRLRAMFTTTMLQANPDAERIDLARETVEFPEPMYHALAERSPDYIIPGLDRIPSDRVTILVPNHGIYRSLPVGPQPRNGPRIFVAGVPGQPGWHFFSPVLGCARQPCRRRGAGIVQGHHSRQRLGHDRAWSPAQARRDSGGRAGGGHAQ